MQRKSDDLFNDYVWLVISILISAFAIWQIPSSLEGVRQEYLLARAGTETIGKVVWLEAGSRCTRSRAGISFSASGALHGVRVMGCGAHPDHLSIGDEVKVRYVVGNPEIAEATVANASTPRQSTIFVGCLWLSVFAALAMAIKEWQKAHAKK